MVFVTRNPRLWMASMAASLIIFAVVYFAVIKPSTDTANQALKSGLQQSQQVLNQAQQQLKSVGGQAGAAGSKALSAAQKLTACVTAAGTDTSKLAACQSHFGG
jgi:type II secretory pathway component PulM